MALTLASVNGSLVDIVVSKLFVVEFDEAADEFVDRLLMP